MRCNTFLGGKLAKKSHNETRCVQVWTGILQNETKEVERAQGLAGIDARSQQHSHPNMGSGLA